MRCGLNTRCCRAGGKLLLARERKLRAVTAASAVDSHHSLESQSLIHRFDTAKKALMVFRMKVAHVSMPVQQPEQYPS